jgi:hypothetical protein
MVALSLYVLFLVLPNQIVCAGRSTVNLRSISSVTVLYRLTVVDLDRVVDKGKRSGQVDLSVERVVLLLRAFCGISHAKSSNCPFCTMSTYEIPVIRSLNAIT